MVGWLDGEGPQMGHVGETRAVAEEEARRSSAGQWRDRYGDDITQMLFLNLFMMGTSSK